MKNRLKAAWAVLRAARYVVYTNDPTPDGFRVLWSGTQRWDLVSLRAWCSRLLLRNHESK